MNLALVRLQSDAFNESVHDVEFVVGDFRLDVEHDLDGVQKGPEGREVQFFS